MCKHERFKVQGNVTRLIDDETGEVVDYRLDVEVWCTDCMTPFSFQGLPKGYMPDNPTTNVEQTEARMPIKPVKL